MIGKTLQNGKYEIKRVLGQGGFGITYEGVQTGLERKVAIKEFFMKDFCEREAGTSMVTIVGTEGNRSLVERFKEKFIKEAQMIAGLEDVSHIIRIYDIFQENGTAYYVMQFIEGGSLDSKVKTEGALNESAAIGYIMQIAEALEKLHAQRIMHLDIKPANVLLRGKDLFLIDFGVSKHYDSEGDATTTTPVGRSKGYAPIEQYRQGGVQSFSPETDIYSLGATAYFLVTGKTPPEATELVIDPLVRPDNISDSLWNAIKVSMCSNKNNRPHSIMEFISILNEQQKEEVIILDAVKNKCNDDTTICDLSSQIGSVAKNDKSALSLRELPPFAWFVLLSCGAGCILAACLSLALIIIDVEYIKLDMSFESYLYWISLLITGISSCILFIYGKGVLKLKHDNAIPLISAFMLSNMVLPILFLSGEFGHSDKHKLCVLPILIGIVFVVYLHESRKVGRLFPSEKRKLLFIDNIIIFAYSSFFINMARIDNGWIGAFKVFVLLEMLIYSPWLYERIGYFFRSNDSKAK